MDEVSSIYEGLKYMYYQICIYLDSLDNLDSLKCFYATRCLSDVATILCRPTP